MLTIQLMLSDSHNTFGCWDPFQPGTGWNQRRLQDVLAGV